MLKIIKISVGRKATKIIMEYKIEGRNAVTEALKTGRSIEKIYIASGGDGRLKAIMRLAKETGTVTTVCDKRKLDEMSATKAHQGVIAVCSAVTYCSIEDILQAAEGHPPLVVIADGITDPHNIGAIIRTACAAGADGLIIPKRRSAGVGEIAEKVASGATQHLKIAKVTNLTSALKELKENGLWICGTDVSGENTIYNQDLKGPLGIVIGSEGEGMSRLIKENCDFLVKIPMLGPIQSLNASVAAGVILYEVVRQRSL